MRLAHSPQQPGVNSNANQTLDRLGSGVSTHARWVELSVQPAAILVSECLIIRGCPGCGTGRALGSLVQACDT